MPHNGNDGGSYIERTSTEERGNTVAVDSAGICLIPEACQTEARISVGGPSVNTMGGGLKQYIGVTRIGSKWRARVSNKNKPDGKENRVHLGMFPTAEMAAIAFDAAFLFLNGDSPANRLNFQEYSAHIKSILQICSPSQTAENIKSVAWKAAQTIAPLIGVENKGRELEVSRLIAQHPKDQALEISPAMGTTNITTASTSLMSSNTGMSDSSSNVAYIPVPAKQRMKVAARAAGRLRAANARGHQLPRKLHVDQQESVNPLNHQIQHGQPSSDKSGIRDSIADVPVKVKQRIKVAARAAGSVRAANARASQI